MEICVFSKRLGSLNCSQLGRELAAAGFSGVNLTVRTGGQVEPEKVVEQLPAGAADLGVYEGSVIELARSERDRFLAMIRA